MTDATAPHRVTVTDMDGNVVETYVTAPIRTDDRPIAIAREALKDAMTLNSIGANDWGEDA